MSRCERFSRIESEIRSAVTAGAYKEAGLLLSSYSGQLETALQENSLQPGQPLPQVIIAAARIEWLIAQFDRASLKPVGWNNKSLHRQDLADVLPHSAQPRGIVDVDEGLRRIAEIDHDRALGVTGA